VSGSDLPASKHGTTFNVFADERHSSLRSCLKEILACLPTANHCIVAVPEAKENPRARTTQVALRGRCVAMTR
jgi:hypothetical protein